MQEWIDKQVVHFTVNFITGDRWKFLLSGLGVTLRITFFALLIGIVIGVVIAMVRSTYDKNAEKMRPPGRQALHFFNVICKFYLTVIRGTPLVVQLMILYFIILINVKNPVMIAYIGFGINSGAYIAEIFRSGIMSIEAGQFEAGRSLGFNYVQTMRYIVIPQAFKNVLPTLVNEFIVLMKETAIAGYLGVQDLAKAGDIIRGRTFSAFMPLVAVALIYLSLILFFAWLVGKLERRLRSSER